LVHKEIVYEFLTNYDKMDGVTFCIWRSKNDLLWRKGKDLVAEGYKDGVDGEAFLLGFIFDTAESWLDWLRRFQNV